MTSATPEQRLEELGLFLPPPAAAVANALYQFDGVRRTQLPMELPKKAKVVVRKGDDN